MKLRNDEQGYGAIAQALHWVMAVGVIALFGLGLWMTSLTYYDAWYHRGPYIHEGIGAFLIAALVFRLLWRIATPTPPDTHLTPLERHASVVVQWGLYGLLTAIMASGYLISTADGRGLNVFDWFSLPAVIKSKGLEEPAGTAHFYLSMVMIGLAALHMIAALKHHFVDRDPTLTRMLPFQTKTQTTGEDSSP